MKFVLNYLMIFFYIRDYSRSIVYYALIIISNIFIFYFFGIIRKREADYKMDV